MKGLIRKEWVLLKWGILALVLANIAVVMALPPMINRAFDLPLDSFENSLIISGTWFVASLFIGVGILFTSLERELKQPDIWLHSPSANLATCRCQSDLCSNGHGFNTRFEWRSAKYFVHAF